MINKIAGIILILTVLLSHIARSETAQDIEITGRQLALELASEELHEASAIEYRRLAMHENDPDEKAGYYWMSAYEYIYAGQPELAQKMLDRSEESSQEFKIENQLLRARTSTALNNTEETQFYLESLLKKPINANLELVATRELAAALFINKNITKAQEILSKSQEKNADGISALKEYQTGRDKNPTLGGFLGMIPGLGYAYSGEYANALRSVILNGIFIYGMVETADEEDWGAFTVISFFELTWYTGSIYGGIDSAHRYNKRRYEACISAIRTESSFEADLKQAPAIFLKFNF